MKAIVLAAGRGSRLREHTTMRPKCLVNFQGRPLLQRTVESLRAGGVSHISVIGGYASHHLKEWVGRGVIDDLMVNQEWNSTNMVATLMLAADHLAESPTVIVYGDIFFEPKIVSDLRRSVSPLAVGFDPDGVALWARRFADPLADIEDFQLAPDGSIARIGSRVTDLSQPEGQFMGLMKTTPAGFETLRDVFIAAKDRSVDMTTALQLVIDSGTEVAGIANLEPWGEIDSPEDLDFFEARQASR